MFLEKLESIQYNSALPVTGTIRGSSSGKIYLELGLEFLQNRRWFRKLCQFYKFFFKKVTSISFNIIPTKLRVHNTRYGDNIPLLKTKHFRNSFFCSLILDCNKLSREVRNSENIRFFKKGFWNLLDLHLIAFFDIYKPYGIKLLTRLHLGLSHLNKLIDLS